MTVLSDTLADSRASSRPTNMDGSTVRRHQQAFAGVPVYNGKFVKRVSYDRNVSVVDECSGETHRVFVRGRTTFVRRFSLLGHKLVRSRAGT